MRKRVSFSGTPVAIVSLSVGLQRRLYSCTQSCHQLFSSQVLSPVHNCLLYPFFTSLTKMEKSIGRSTMLFFVWTALLMRNVLTQTVSINKDADLLKQRDCVQLCVNGDWGRQNLVGAVGCGSGRAESCFCDAALRPSASAHLASCLSTDFSTCTDVYSNAVSIYDRYCTFAVPATATAVATSSDTPTQTQGVVTVSATVTTAPTVTVQSSTSSSSSFSLSPSPSVGELLLVAMSISLLSSLLGE